MKKRIDFIINEDELSTTIFRFLPRQSSCHSFDENPPKNWNEVYKVYYAYKVFRRWKFDNKVEELFYCNFDECSIIRSIANNIEHIINNAGLIKMRDKNGREYPVRVLGTEMQPLGDGVSWTINEKNSIDNEIFYQIIIWNNNKGYRFYLKKNKLKEFGKYLNFCCEYMLKHGEPI